MQNRKLQLTCFAIAAFVATTPVAKADMTCRISMEITKGGFVIGAAGGSGTINCHGQRYPI